MQRLPHVIAWSIEEGGGVKIPRIRYLKPEFFKDEDLAEFNFEVRLFYAGLWGLADKAGRLEDRPKRFKAEIFPYDNVDVEKCLNLLSQPKRGSGRPFLNRYETDGQRYIQILEWAKHQKPHHTEKDSEIPPAPPLTEKGTEKGMEKQLEASTELKNGEVTVKEPVSPPIVPQRKTSRGGVAEKPEEVPDNVWNEFLLLRKQKKSTFSGIALAGIQREANKAGMTITEALTMSIERGWQGFRAEWVANRTSGAPPRQSSDPEIEWDEDGNPHPKFHPPTQDQLDYLEECFARERKEAACQKSDTP